MIAIESGNELNGGDAPSRAFATPPPFEFSCLLFSYNPRTFWNERRGTNIPQILQKKSKVVASKSAEIIRGYRFGPVIESEGETNGVDDPASRKALWPSQIKAPWVKVSLVLIVSELLLSSSSLHTLPRNVSLEQTVHPLPSVRAD